MESSTVNISNHSGKSLFTSIQTSPGTVLLLLQVTALMIASNYNLFTFDVFSFTIFIPNLTLAIVELRSNKENREDLYTERYKSVISRYQMFFLAGGYIQGIIWLFLIFLIGDYLEIYNENLTYSFLMSMLVTFVILFMTISIIIILNSLQQEDNINGTRFKLYSHPNQMIQHYLYVVSGSTTPLVLFLVAFNVNYTIPSSYLSIYENSIQNAASKGMLLFILTINIMSLLFMSVLSHDLQHFFIKTRNRIPSNPYLQKALARLSIAVIINLMIFLLITNSNTKVPMLFTFSIAVALYVGITFQNNRPLSPNYCQYCNNILIAKDDHQYCPSCDVANLDSKTSIKIPTKIVHPQCPSCGNNWEEMSRKCQHCGFIIILTCPNCYQTLNPLWKTCSNCKTDIKAVPELALTRGDSPQYASALVNLRLILIPIIIYLTFDVLFILVINGLIQDGVLKESQTNLIFASVIRSFIFISTGLAILFLNFNFSKDYFKPIILLISRLVFIPVQIFASIFVIIIALDSIKNFFVSFSLFSIGYFALGMLIAFLFFRSQLSALFNFKPIIKFEPVLLNRILTTEVKRDE